MNRTVLKWFYIFVQFSMLLISIPKVGALFHAYDSETFGPLVMGLDLRSWLVGISIDLCAALTSWAALTKFESMQRRRDLLAPAVIIGACVLISVAANYEDAATHLPAQFAHVSFGAYSALVVNPFLVSSPPLIVLLLIALVPSVLAAPVMKTAAQLLAETEAEEARIAAEARLKVARTKANAQIREAQLGGFAATAHVAKTQATRLLKGEDASAQTGVTPDAHDGPDDDPDDGPGGGQRAHETAHDAHAILNMPSLTTASLGNASVTRTIRRDAQNRKDITRARLQTLLTINETQARRVLQDFQHANPTLAATRTHRNAAYIAPLGAFRSWLRVHDRFLYDALVDALEREASMRRSVSPVSRAASSSSALHVLPRVASGVASGVSDVSQPIEA